MLIRILSHRTSLALRFFFNMDLLPHRHTSHSLEDISRQRFRAAFGGPLFIVRNETSPDYGVDASIEALTNGGRSATNIRAFVHLKGTAKPPLSDGSYRINIKIQNINYLLNSHSSFYCLYLARSDQLYFRSTLSIMQELRGYPEIPAYKKFISVRFNEPIDASRVSAIHSEMVQFAETIRELEHFVKIDNDGEGEESLVVTKTWEAKEVYASDDKDIVAVFAVRVDEFGNSIHLEHEIWEMRAGDVPRGYEVFHKNGMTLDNRNTNLAIRPIDPNKFLVEVFRTPEENINARRILDIIIRGETALEEPKEPPTPMLFWDVVRLLQRQNMSMKQRQVEVYKKDCATKLGIGF